MRLRSSPDSLASVVLCRTYWDGGRHIAQEECVRILSGPRGRLARYRFLDLALLLLATLTRLWGLEAPSLWMDEAFSHAFATLPLGTAWEAMIVDGVHPPLYYLLLRPWLTLAGGSEFSLRFPSMVVGIVTVALVIRAGRQWLGEGAARWAGLLLAVNPFHVWYSQEARMYALLGTLSIAVLMAFWRALHSGRLRSWTIFALLSALAYSTHYFALYLPLVQFVCLLMTFRRHHQVLARWTVMQALAALPLASWLVALYTIAGDTFGIGWIPRPHLADLLETLWAFGMAYDGQVTPLVVIGTALWLGLVALAVCREAGMYEPRQSLLLSLILPPLVTFLLSLRRPTYVDRFFIGGVPAFVVLAAAGLARLPRSVHWVVGFALVALGLWGVARFHFDPMFAKEDWRGAARHIEVGETSGDVLALRHFQYVVPFGYYYEGALEPEWVTLNRVTRQLSELVVGSERLWLVLRASHTDAHHLAWSEPLDITVDEMDPVVRNWIAAHRPEAIQSYPGVSVILFELGEGP